MFDEFDVIHSYTRAQALADGVLVDVTETSKKFGFRIPIALTAVVWIGCCEWTDYDEARKPCGQDMKGRLWDVLTMAAQAAKRTDGPLAPFSVLRIPRSGERMTPEKVDLILHIGAGDAGEPVCTIMEPGED